MQVAGAVAPAIYGPRLDQHGIAFRIRSGRLTGLPGIKTPAAHRGFLFLEWIMRTYDKLIAAIFARRAKGGLRPSPGVDVARVSSSVNTCVTWQES